MIMASSVNAPMCAPPKPAPLAGEAAANRKSVTVLNAPLPFRNWGFDVSEASSLPVVVRQAARVVLVVLLRIQLGVPAEL